MIKVTQSQTHYIFAVADNGPGIAKAGREKIFDLFEVGTKADKYGKSGNGIRITSYNVCYTKLLRGRKDCMKIPRKQKTADLSKKII